jgi:hypothetical protein
MDLHVTIGGLVDLEPLLSVTHTTPTCDNIVKAINSRRVKEVELVARKGENEKSSQFRSENFKGRMACRSRSK